MVSKRCFAVVLSVLLTGFAEGSQETDTLPLIEQEDFSEIRQRGQVREDLTSQDPEIPLEVPSEKKGFFERLRDRFNEFCERYEPLLSQVVIMVFEDDDKPFC